MLNLSVTRGSAPISVEHNKQLQPIVYEEPVVYDLSEPPVYVVDQQGNVFESQCSSRSLSLHTREQECLERQAKKCCGRRRRRRKRGI